MIHRIPTRTVALAIVAFCSGLLGYAYYTQYVDGLDPCPLCMSQRLAYYACALIALALALHHPATPGRRIYASLLTLASGAGLWIAARQVWLQMLPEDQVPACGPSVEYLIENFPFASILRAMLMGDGNCALVDWTFLGLSMAAWSGLCFLALLLTSSVLLLRREPA